MLSKETLAEMRLVVRTKWYIDDPEWTVRRALELLDEVVELRKQVEFLGQLALTCCACGKVMEDMMELKRHIVVCPEHPIAQYVAAERERIIAIIQEYLLYDSQRAVSWHEVQDVLDEIRKGAMA